MRVLAVVYAVSVLGVRLLAYDTAILFGVLLHLLHLRELRKLGPVTGDP
ncbi:hypothetical protein [Streptomyces sp. OR43]|nr:hypothetical protein [Streptomyces sp. or43]